MKKWEEFKEWFWRNVAIILILFQTTGLVIFCILWLLSLILKAKGL